MNCVLPTAYCALNNLLRKLFPHCFPLAVERNNLFPEKDEEQNVRQHHQVENGVVDSSVYRHTVVTPGFCNGFTHRALGIGAQREDEREDCNQNEYAMDVFHSVKIRVRWELGDWRRA